MFDLKTINAVVTQLKEERGLPEEKIVEALEMSLASAYKKEYGKKGQIVRCELDVNAGDAEYYQVKIVADESSVRFPVETDEEEAGAGEADKAERAAEAATAGRQLRSREGEEEEVLLPLYNPEQHILLADARMIKGSVEVGEEIIFPLEKKSEFGRIAAQTAKQVLYQKIREAEKQSVYQEYGEKEGQIVSGIVQRMERGNTYIDLGRAAGIMSYDDQIPGERLRPGARVRCLLYRVEESPRGVFLRLSRSHPDFLKKLFENEAPELASGVIGIEAIAREAGSRSKIAVFTNDPAIDPVGSMVGQRGVRVSTVMSELGGEKIDIIEWSEDPAIFIEDALSPADVLEVEINEEEATATVTVARDQLSLAIGRGGQNVRLAAKLTGSKIDIHAHGEEEVDDTEAEVASAKPETEANPTEVEEEALENDGEHALIDAVAPEIPTGDTILPETEENPDFTDTSDTNVETEGEEDIKE